MAPRAYTQREWRLLSWWLVTYHPHAEIYLNLRVGPTALFSASPADAATLGNSARVRNRWIDALLIENGDPTMVEAKLEPDPGIFSQLLHYARKFRADPNWRGYADRPLKLVALVYNDDPSVAIEAPWYGVSWVVYQPPLNEMPPAAQGLTALPMSESALPLPANWPARLQSWGIRALT